jgi:hypothetical protein
MKATIYSLILVLFFTSNAFTQVVVNGTIGANEYGTHTNGANQNTNGSSVTYVSWDASNLYVAVTGANLAEAHVFYLDRNPVTPVNGGTNADGTNVGFTYDNTNFAELPFRAELVMFVRNTYREYRTSNGSNGWSGQTSNFGSYGENGTGSVREYSIPWSVIGGAPTAGFNFFCYNTSGGGFVYNQQPVENPNESIGTSARYSRYFTVTDATVGTGTPPFSRNSYVFTGTGNINNFGAISVWDFTMNTSSLQIARSNAGGNWSIGGTLRVNNGTVFFGSGGSGYGTTNLANVAITGSGSLNMDQTNQALNISGNLVQTGGTFFLSGTVGGDVVIQGNWTRDGGTFTNNARAVTFNSTGAQAIGGTATTDFGFLTINKATGALTLNRSANVNNLLTLTSGIVNTSATNILTITNTGAGSVSGGSGTSHINGPLVRNLPANLVSGSTYNFPVGKGGNYYPFTLVNPTSGANTPAITVEAFNANAGGTAGVGISSLSTTEYWSASFTGNYTGGSVSLARPTSLGTLNVIGRSATANGTYSKLNGTVSGNSVINSDNTGAALGFFTFGMNVPAPTITSLGSTSGCPGDQLVINGTNFTGADAAGITIGGTPVASIVSNTGTVLTVVVGAGTTGAVSVTIAGQTGTSGASYTVNPTPADPGNPTSDSPQCATPGVTLTRNGTPSGGDTWYWQTSASGTSTANSGATFNVTASGTYFIRAQNAGGCWSLGAGSVTVVVNDVPAAATTPTPANNATNVCYAGGGVVNSVSWTAVAGATSYDVYFGAGSLPGSVTANVATNSYSTGTLSASTTYFWQVVAKNACGDAVGSATWQFTTAASACGLTYCAPTYTNPLSNDYITQVTLGTLSQSTASNVPVYINYTTTQNAIPNLSQLGTFNLNITFGNDPNQYSGIWIDFNQNGTFETTEFIAGPNTGSGGTAVIPITIPIGASLGITTMRIRGGEDNPLTSSMACGTSSNNYGQAQDYLVNIIVPQPTLAVSPASLGFGNVQNGSSSTEQSFGLSGFAFSPASGNLTVTAPTGYQVSLTSGSGFAGSVNVPYSGGALSSTPVYVIFSPNAADQLFSGNIVCSGGGAANSVNVSVIGNSYTTTSVLFDDFNRTDNNTVGIPTIGGTQAWSETEIGGVPHRIRIANNILRLHGCTTTTGFDAGDGADYLSFNGGGFIPANFSTANTTLTWKFNMRQTRTNPSGFNENNYGAAFVIACDEANFRSSTADGYAVILGNTNTPDPVRLVSFTGGLTSNANVTFLTASSLTDADNYYSVVVSLNTCTGTFTLQVRDDGATAFADPNTGTFTSTTTSTVGSYVSASLPFFGALWNHITACSDFAQFDNFYIPTGARPAVGPVTGTASACAGTTGLTYSIPAVAGATAYAWTVPTGWNITAGGTTNSITVTAGAFGENGNISVSANNSCGTIGTSAPLAVTTLATNAVSVSITANQVSPICAGTVVEYSATSTNAGTNPVYAWTLNGAPVGGNSANYTATPLEGINDVQVTLTSDVSCPTGNPATSNIISITVNPIVTPSVSIAASPSNSVCDGDLVTFTATLANEGTSPIYEWFVNGNSVGALNTYSSSSLVTGDIVSLEMTSDALCTTTNLALSNNITMTVNPFVAPSVTIAANIPSPICAGTSVTFTATALNAGTTPSYAWFVNATPVGSNSATFTTTSLVSGDVVSVVVTSNAVCASPATATSNTLTYTITAAPTWYQDVDSDGYTTGVTQVACTQPVGFRLPGALISLTLIDCNDNNDDINPGQEEFCNGLDDDCDTFIDEGLLNLTYYRDLDGDGFGNPLVTQVACAQPTGFVLNNTDCNDNNANVFPGRTEVCNGIDDDCDTVIDEGCGAINDELFTALVATQQNYGSCTGVTGSLAGAFASTQAGVTCPTGEDVWYYFEAQTTAVSIQCSSTINNIVIELHDENGNIITSENAVAGIGNERLNHVGLSVGITYYIRIRNFNSAVSAGGTFQLCIQRILASSCNLATSPSNTISPCGSFKADYTAANQYIFNIGGFVYSTGLSTGFANTWMPLTALPQLQYGQVYNVSIDAVYLIPNAAGQIETITVPGIETCQLHLGAQPSLSLRATDSCPNIRPRTAFVRAEPRICSNVVDYEWEFTQVLPMPGLAQTHLRGANDRNLRLNTVPFLMNGATYNVRIRPIFAGNVPGAWSATPSCLRIAAGLGMVTGKDENLADISGAEWRMSMQESEAFQPNIYPNPNNGEAITLAVAGAPSGALWVNITDATGRQVSSLQYQIEYQNFTTQLDLPQALHQGIYFVEIITADNRREVLRVIVQK